LKKQNQTMHNTTIRLLHSSPISLVNIGGVEELGYQLFSVNYPNVLLAFQYSAQNSCMNFL